MREHGSSPVIIFHAALSLARSDPERGLGLLRNAEALDPTNRVKYESSIATIYADAELQGIHAGSALNNIQMSDDSGARLRGQLKDLRDPALLAETGCLLTKLTWPGSSDEQFHRGLELIREAIKLDPDNARWPEALQSAEAETQRRLNYERLIHRQ